MEIKIDTRKVDNHYYDKELNHIANNNDIIKLTNNDGASPFNVVIDILASSLKLNEQEKNVLSLINYYNNINNIQDILDRYKSDYNRSKTTFNRCIETLKKKRVIKVDSRGLIKVNEKYIINNNTSAKARFLVIELSPDLTSKHISI